MFKKDIEKIYTDIQLLNTMDFILNIIFMGIMNILYNFAEMIFFLKQKMKQ